MHSYYLVSDLMLVKGAHSLVRVQMDQTPSHADETVHVPLFVSAVIHCYPDDESDLLHRVEHW